MLLRTLFSSSRSPGVSRGIIRTEAFVGRESGFEGP